MTKQVASLENLSITEKTIFSILNIVDRAKRIIRQNITKLIIKQCGQDLRVFGGIKMTCAHSITIGNRCALNHGAVLMGRGGLTIGNDVVISAYSVITTDSLDHRIKTLPRPHISKPITIKDGAWVGSHTTILPGVTIGQNAIVAAGAVVHSDVPDNAMVTGIPATVKKMIEVDKK